MKSIETGMSLTKKLREKLKIGVCKKEVVYKNHTMRPVNTGLGLKYS